MYCLSHQSLYYLNQPCSQVPNSFLPSCAFLCCHFALLPLILSWLLCLAYDSQAVGAKRVSLYCPPIGPQCTRSSVLFNGWWKVYCVCFYSTDRRFSAQSHCPLHIQRHTETHRSHTHSYRFAFLSGARLTPLYSQPCTRTYFIHPNPPSRTYQTI